MHPFWQNDKGSLFLSQKMEWYVPITLLPGICLLLLSTATLTVSLNDEIRDMLNQNDCDVTILSKKLKQLKKLTISKTGIYISIAMFVFAGLVAGLNQKGLSLSSDIANILIALGVMGLLTSLVYLVIYSIHAVKIRQQQFKRFISSK